VEQRKRVAGALLATTVGLTSVTALTSPAEANPNRPIRIKGLVTTPGKAPLPLADVRVVALAQMEIDGLSQWVEVDSDTTGDDGRYNVGKLEHDVYRVQFDDLSKTYVTEYWDDALRLEDAQNVVLKPGDKRTLPDVQLGGIAQLTGKVTGSSGEGLAGAEVTTYRKRNDAWQEFETVVTDANGTYVIDHLLGGDYTLRFFDPISGVTEYWNNKLALSDAGTIQLQSSGVSDQYDAQLATPVAEEPTPEPTPEPTLEPTPTPTTPTTTTGTTTGTTTSTATGTSTTTASAGKVLVVKKPRIKGFAKVDQRLRVTKGAWNPTTAKRKIQWLANGKKIKGATKMRLRLTRKMAGKKISVKVTAKAAGMTSVTVRTAPTKKVKR
jgi:hypothetical protein